MSGLVFDYEVECCVVGVRRAQGLVALGGPRASGPGVAMHGHALGKVGLGCVPDLVSGREVGRWHGTGEVASIEDGVVLRALVAAATQGGEAVGIALVRGCGQPATGVGGFDRFANGVRPLLHALQLDQPRVGGWRLPAHCLGPLEHGVAGLAAPREVRAQIEFDAGWRFEPGVAGDAVGIEPEPQPGNLAERCEAMQGQAPNDIAWAQVCRFWPAAGVAGAEGD